MTKGVGAEEPLALAHVRKVEGFYIHLAQYCVVVSILAIVNLLTYPRYFWVIWVAVGWESGFCFTAYGFSTKYRF